MGTNDAERRVAKRADELGRARIRYCSKRSGQQAAEQHHPIGAKDVGESPNVGGVSAFSNAVNDAFAHLGLTHTQMPHDHWRVWKTAQSLGLTAG